MTHLVSRYHFQFRPVDFLFKRYLIKYYLQLRTYVIIFKFRPVNFLIIEFISAWVDRQAITLVLNLLFCHQIPTIAVSYSGSMLKQINIYIDSEFQMIISLSNKNESFAFNFTTRKHITIE